MLLFGFLTIGGAGVAPAGGFGYYSSNALSLINPMGPAILPTLPTVSDGQKEGYGYLGLGAILVIVAGLFLAAARQRLFTQFSLPLLAVAIAAFLFALSHKVTFGPYTLVIIPLRGALADVAAIFRSSGRFVWVTNYILVTLSVFFVARLASMGRAIAILLVGVALQTADLAPQFDGFHRRFTEFSLPRFSGELFADLGRHHDRLMVIPPWQCWSSSEKQSHPMIENRIAFLAFADRLETNSFRAGRMPLEQERYHCQDFPAVFGATEPRKKTAYLFTLSGFMRFGPMVLPTHACDLADDLILCRGDRGAAGLSAQEASAFDELVVETDKILRPTRSSLWPKISHGFGGRDGASITGNVGRFDLSSHLSADSPYRMEVWMASAAEDESGASIDVYLNSLRLGSLGEARGEFHGLLPVPAGVTRDLPLVLAFVDRSPRPVHPSLARLSFHAETGTAPRMPMTFAFNGGIGSSRLLANGWSSADDSGVWSDAKVSVVEIPHDFLGAGPVSIDIDASVFIAPERGLGAQNVQVSANGDLIGAFRLTESNARLVLTIPGSAVKRNPDAIELRFELPDAARPADLGVSLDDRQLAIGLKSLVARPAP